MIAFVPLILLPVFATLIVAQGVTEQGFKLIITQRAKRRAVELARQVGAFYRINGTWEGIGQSMIIPPWLPFVRVEYPFLIPQEGRIGGHFEGQIAVYPSFNVSEHVLIIDPEGHILASNGGELIAPGQRVQDVVIQQGVPIDVDGQTIGRLVMGEAIGLLNDQQQEVLLRINTVLIVSGVVAGSAAVLFAAYIGWQITRPAQELMIGVRRLSARQWNTDQPLRVISQNEFGELTRAFNEMAGEVTRQEALRRQMVADVAHDLRTPLMTMQLEVDAIETGRQTPAEAVLSLREEIDFLKRLVEDLRLLSLMDSHQVEMMVTPTPLYPFLVSLQDFFWVLADEQDCRLILDATSELPTLEIDQTRLRQVFANLIDNAIRHTPNGGQITLRGRVVGNTVQLSVCDNGEGIAPEHIPHLFNRFYRADQARTHHRTGHSGSGLGLSIAQKLIELHKGHIRVESQLGKGSVFSVTLPIPMVSNPPPDPRPRFGAGRPLLAFPRFGRS
jgi:signal transduction histidine kinase